MSRARMTVCALVMLGCLRSDAPLAARESNGTSAARALFAQGEAAAKAGRLADAATAFRRAIDADPDFVDVHQRFIETTQRQEMPASRTPVVPGLQQLYEGWARRYRKRAVYQWALGFLAPEADTADVFFKKAIAIDPAFARAYYLLAKDADQRGDWTAQLNYLKAAVDSNPDDPRYLLQYGFAQRKTEPDRFRQLALAVVDRFPTSQSAAQALYYLADQSSNPERRGYFDRLRSNYSIDRYNYAASAMYDLYDDLTDPSEALSVAREMAEALPANRTWPQRVAIQEAMVRAQALVTAGRFGEALDLLGRTPQPSGTHGTTWTLLKAEAAAGAGHVDQAYGTLAENAASVPDDRIDRAIRRDGAALGKTREAIEADVWRIRDAKAAVAAPFQLPASRDGTPVRLSDYRGRVVLIAFWFPG